MFSAFLGNARLKDVILRWQRRLPTLSSSGVMLRGAKLADYSSFETELGMPLPLFYWIDQTLPHLSADKRRSMSVALIEAIRPGADLQSCWWDFAPWLLTDENWGVKRFAESVMCKSLELVVRLHQTRETSQTSWRKALDKARAAQLSTDSTHCEQLRKWAGDSTDWGLQLDLVPIMSYVSAAHCIWLSTKVGWGFAALPRPSSPQQQTDLAQLVVAASRTAAVAASFSLTAPERRRLSQSSPEYLELTGAPFEAQLAQLINILKATG